MSVLQENMKSTTNVRVMEFLDVSVESKISVQGVFSPMKLPWLMENVFAQNPLIHLILLVTANTVVFLDVYHAWPDLRMSVTNAKMTVRQSRMDFANAQQINI